MIMRLGYCCFNKKFKAARRSGPPEDFLRFSGSTGNDIHGNFGFVGYSTSRGLSKRTTSAVRHFFWAPRGDGGRFVW